MEIYLQGKNVDELIIGGIMTNLCVRSAVSDAYDRDFRLTVVKDACVSDSASTDRFTFKDIRATRPEVDILTAAQVVKRLASSK